MLSEDEKERLVKNIAGHLIGAQAFLQERAISNFSKADKDYGARIRYHLELLKPKGISNDCQPKL